MTTDPCCEQPEDCEYRKAPFEGRSRLWLLVLAFLNVVLASDTGRLPPYFNAVIWQAMYMAIALHLIIFYFFRQRKWFLRSSSLITAAAFLRGISFFVYDQRLAALALNMNIVILTWAFYKARWFEVPAERRAR